MSTGRLTCARHGKTAVDRVCGACGTPSCDECIETIADPTFRSFSPAGMGRVAVGLGLLVGVPLLFTVITPGLLNLEIGEVAIWLERGVVHGSVLVGAAILLGSWVRVSDDGYDVLDGRGHERHLCEDCVRSRNRLTTLQTGITGVAIVIGLLGTYWLFQGLTVGTGLLFLTDLRVIGLAVAVYILRDELTIVAAQVRG